MIKRFNRVEIRASCWVIACSLIMLVNISAQAQDTARIDADGGADFTSLDAVLNQIQIVNYDPEVVLFVGDDQDTYTWTVFCDKSLGDIRFVGMQKDPDLFPIINFNAESYNLGHNNNLAFENLIFTGIRGIDFGQGAKTHSFKKCVFRDFTGDNVIIKYGNSGGTTLIENCLFEGNTTTRVLEFDFWEGTNHTLRILNCTFDNNTNIWFQDENLTSAFTIRNCIFSNNGTTFPGNNLKAVTTYSLTSEALTGYGTGCVSNPNPLYSVAGPASRSAPADWRPTPSSPARNLGISTGTPTPPTVDISDTIRIQDSTGRRDAGCWDIRDTAQPPDITSHLPSDTAIGIGKPVVFRITATGTAPLTYSWRKVGSAAEVSTADSFKIDTTKASDDSTRYYCVVKNSKDSVWSDTVLLLVVALPVITDQPDSAFVYSGDSVTFSITATGGEITYAWNKNGVAIPGATSSTYKYKAIAGDTLFTCTVTNLAGSVTSNAALLRVLSDTLKIISRTEDAFLTEGSSITLKVVAQGRPELQYLWKKVGDTTTLATADSLVLNNLVQTTGTVYRCIVSNSAGKDSADITIVVIAGTIYNPLTLTGTFVDPTRVLLTIGNYLVLPSDAGTDPYVDTIGVWYSTLTFPSGTLSPTASGLVKIPLQQLRSDADNSYDTVIQYIATPPDSCKSLYLVASPFWNNPDTILPVASGPQSSKVFMCSADTLVNKLVLDVAYQRVSDSMVVTISNLTSINRDSLMYLVLQYGIGTGAFSADSTMKIYPADLPEASVNLLSKTIHDSLLAGFEDSLTVRVFWRGSLGNTSIPPVIKKISIGRLRPPNDALLSIDSTTTSALYLHWQFPGTTDFDSIRIWWGRVSVPLAAEFDTATFDFMNVKKGVTDTVITGLLSNAFYSVGLQIAKASVWSMVTESSRDTATTKSPFQATIPNTIKLVASFFDTNTNLITVTWNIDTTGTGPVTDLETGIVWAVGTSPTDLVPADRFGKIVSNLKIKDNSEEIDLGEDLVFSSTYYLALLLRRKSDVGWAPSTDSSRGTVVVPEESWQRVFYFDATDTVVTAFNGKVILGKSGNGTVSVIDTLRVFKPDSVPRGFVIVSKLGIDFVNDVKSDPINIGLQYNPTLPQGLTPADIRMYQYHPDSGWRVIDICTLDTVRQIVSVAKRTSEYQDPFILMIDTLRPAIAILSDTGSSVLPKTDIPDTIVIADNVTNSSARLFYWLQNGKDDAIGPIKKCNAELDTVIITVPGRLISDDMGVRVLLVISDGRFVSTIDISRKVIRTLSSKSDDVNLKAKRWTPLSTTTLLNDRSIENALDELGNDDKWEYDSTRFRIFRWVDTASVRNIDAAAGDTNWVEYRSVDSQLFQLVPGRVIWIKTWKDISAKLGDGTTVSMKEPFAVTLNANDWTDMALPYKFNIKIGDIVNETSADTALTNRVQIYKWEISDILGGVVSQQKYIPGIPSLDSMTSSLDCDPAADAVGTYTIFNASPTDIVLKIPPVPETYSSFTSGQGGIGKRKDQAEWSIVVEARTGKGSMTPVYCGFRPGTGVSRFPAAPSFSKQQVMVIDTQNNTAYGNLVYHEADNGGFVFPLQFGNEEGKPIEFNYNIIVPASLPPSYRTGVYDPVIKKIDRFTATKTLSVDGHAKAYRWLLVGDSSYMASWSVKVSADLALFRVSPSPCRGAMRIQFNIPYDDIQHIQVALFNQLGRRVWRRELTRQALHPGLNEVLLQPTASGSIGAGTYIILLTSINGKGKILGTRRQKVVYLP